jgi:hypothetical protein
MTTARKFQVEVLTDRVVSETVYERVPSESDPTRNVMLATKRDRIVPESYMVYFPLGHSIWVETKAELARIGAMPGTEVEVDMETGEIVSQRVVTDLKANALRMAPARPQGVM